LLPAILNENGFDTTSTKYWETPGVDRIIMGNGITRFTLKLKKFYFFPEVVKRCEMLGITVDDIPEDIRDEFKTCFEKYIDEQNKWLPLPEDKKEDKGEQQQ